MANIKDVKRIEKLLRKRSKLLGKYHAAKRMNPAKIVLVGVPDDDEETASVKSGFAREVMHIHSGNVPPWAVFAGRFGAPQPRVKIKADDTIKTFLLSYLLDQITAIDDDLIDLGFEFNAPDIDIAKAAANAKPKDTD